MKVTFPDYLILMFFSHLDIREGNNRSHRRHKNGNLKRKNRHVLTPSDLSITFRPTYGPFTFSYYFYPFT